MLAVMVLLTSAYMGGGLQSEQSYVIDTAVE